jgi:hypothetical protein
MIQDPSKEVTLIIYDTPKPPKYIKINKILMRSLIFFIPLIVIMSIGFSMFTSVYMKTKLEEARSQEPEIIQNLRVQNSKLTSQVDLLQATKVELISKISTGGSDNTSTEIQTLVNLFLIPLGFEDKRDEIQAKLENINNDNLSGKVLFKFDILNNKKDKSKLSGHISILQYHKDGVSFYPNYNLSPDKPNLIFSKGESFVVSKFRPVVAEFSKPKGSVVWYKIFIFSHTGNLLAFKKTQNFTLD